MKPGRTCGICSSSDLSLKCDGLLASGFSLVEIAAQLGVSKYTVSRHGRHSALKLSDDDTAKLPADKLDVLYDRCESLFHSLAASGDAKAASDILKVQARLAEAACQREEKRQQTEADDPHDPLKPPRPEYMTWIRDKVHACYEASVASGNYIWCPAGCGRPVPPEVALANIKAYLESHDANSSANAN